MAHHSKDSLVPSQDTVEAIDADALSAADQLIRSRVPAVFALDRDGRILQTTGPAEAYLNSGSTIPGSKIADQTSDSLRLCIVNLLNSANAAIEAETDCAREDYLIWIDPKAGPLSITVRASFTLADSPATDDAIILLTITRKDHLFATGEGNDSSSYLQALESLLRVNENSVPDYDDRIRHIISVGIEFSGLEFGFLARTNRNMNFVESLAGQNHPRLQVGMAFSKTEFFGPHLDHNHPVVADHAWEKYPGPQQAWHSARAYIAAPVHVHGKVYGSYCIFANTERARPFSQTTLNLVITLARWLGYKIERRMQLETHRQREAELQLIFDTIPACIWQKNSENSIIRRNKAAELADDGRDMHTDLSRLDNPDYEADDLVQLMSADAATRVTERGNQSEQQVWYRTEKVPHTNPVTGEQGLLIVATDVTAVKLREEQLHDLNAELARQRTHYREHYRNTPVMMHSIGPDGAIVEVSDYWLERLGYDRDEVIGKKSLDFLTEESKSYAQDVVFPAFWKDGVCRGVPYQFICKNGSLIDIELSGVAMSSGIAGEKQTLAVLIDVTERNKALRETATKNHELETANAALQSFAFIASHDLKEPLRKISLFSEFLATEYQDKLEGDGQYYLDVLSSSAVRMKRLISDLLTYCRLSHQSCALESVDLNDVVRTIAEELDLVIAETYSTLVFDDLPTVMADRLILEQLIRNLIANAIKYRDEDRLPLIEITAERNEADRTLTLCVSDNGSGFDPEQAERIFEPFVRLQSRDRQSGTGIGLAICRAAADRHGWTIKAESTPGEGSVFRITIPAQRA